MVLALFSNEVRVKLFGGNLVLVVLRKFVLELLSFAYTVSGVTILFWEPDLERRDGISISITEPLSLGVILFPVPCPSTETDTVNKLNKSSFGDVDPVTPVDVAVEDCALILTHMKATSSTTVHFEAVIAVERKQYRC